MLRLLIQNWIREFYYI